ncbi:MAG: hypothetical protein JOY94_06085 [Methylobacteriaceae bacterium]|nr:hypothetical protein [Methylobacteriaceae bacterium]
MIGLGLTLLEIRMIEMIDFTERPRMLQAAFGLGSGARNSEPVRERTASPISHRNAPDSCPKHRELLLLLHADFAIFQPGAICDRKRAAQA